MTTPHEETAPDTDTDTDTDAPAPHTAPRETDDTDHGQTADSKPHREAARYRTQLRATEAERDALAGRLETLQRAEAERHAQGGNGLHNGADLWVFGADVSELLDDDGRVSPDKVSERVNTILDERPYLRRQRFQGTADGGARRGTTTRTPDLADLFKRD
ncbi:hypothetical protein [Nocardiopsis lucentensis]|uniref:hypothetical protein n=1 Tax=Nocardiopsis lucentensis TaxID=53441 RepID=UPI000345150E|nr:hypothetical protein [Nocardiopsis lucentensis]